MDPNEANQRYLLAAEIIREFYEAKDTHHLQLLQDQAQVSLIRIAKPSNAKA